MRRATLLLALVSLPVPAWLGTDACLRALVLPRLEERLRARVTVDRLRPAWPPGLSLQGVRTTGSSPLKSAGEIVVGINGIVLRRGVIRLGPPPSSPHEPSPGTPPATPVSLPRIVAEDCTVHVTWAQGWLRADGVSARPTASGWRVTARSLRLGRDGLVLEAGPAAADVTEKRSWHRIALTGATVEAHGIRVGPMLIRASDGWSPEGPSLELVLARDEARLSGKRLSGWISGRARIHLPPGKAARVSAELDLRDVVVSHAALAGRPVGPSSASLVTESTIEATALSLQRLVLSTGAIEVEVRGRFGSDVTDASVALARTSCASALASLPDGLAPKLAGMSLGGEIEASARFHVERVRPDDAALELSFPVICQAMGDPPAAPMQSVGSDVAPLRSYGKLVPAAFQVAEDLRFWEHDGFDAEQIKNALVHDLTQGSFSRGASTISQQVVKNLFLSHERTLSRKLQEAVLTWRMEQVVEKRRILEAYLDLVELGPGIRGVQAASQAYFGRAARALTPLQAVHLAALTPAPIRLSRALSGGVTPAWRTRLDELLDFMRHERQLSVSDWMRARAQRLVIRPWPTSPALSRNGSPAGTDPEYQR